jgi:hypothetical protein
LSRASLLVNLSPAPGAFDADGFVAATVGAGAVSVGEPDFKYEQPVRATAAKRIPERII